jgi:hypothetical protein
MQQGCEGNVMLSVNDALLDDLVREAKSARFHFTYSFLKSWIPTLPRFVLRRCHHQRSMAPPLQRWR